MAKLKEKRAIALIAAYLVITVLTILGVAFVDRGIYQNRAILTFEKQTNAFDLAESGLDQALYWLRTRSAPPTGSGNLWTNGTQSLNFGNHTPPIVAGNYTINITDLGSPGGTNRRYRVTAVGTCNNINQTLRTYLQTDNYARYIWFTDGENYGGTNVWFWTQDYLDGPTHTNGHFNIYGDPTFAGEVRSVDDYIRYYNNGNNINSGNLSNPPYDEPDFQEGMTFGAEDCPMPTQALNLRSAASDAVNGGISLRGNTTIVLLSNGTMNITNIGRGWNRTNMALPANGALFVDTNTSGTNRGGYLNISGTLSGRLTVGAARDIIIPGNITYAHDPRINSSSTDTLGIISERNVMLLHSATYDMEIDASIMALQTSFLLDDWDDGPAKGNLTIFGGIIQDERGPVGTFRASTGEKLSGYSKDYSYDDRLLVSPPPFVPTTGDYITLSWED